jgi:hypothetical protein
MRPAAGGQAPTGATQLPDIRVTATGPKPPGPQDARITLSTGTGIPAGQALSFWQGRNPHGAALRGVRQDELHITAEAARMFERDHPGLGVRVYGPSSGTRTSGSVANHGPGWALDMQIYDKATGKIYANIRSVRETARGWSPGRGAIQATSNAC